MKQKIPVKILTQEDVDSGKYTILDIILPLPGHMVDYPPNMVDYYEELLAKDGLNLEMKHKFKYAMFLCRYYYNRARQFWVAGYNGYFKFWCLVESLQ